MHVALPFKHRQFERNTCCCCACATKSHTHPPMVGHPFSSSSLAHRTPSPADGEHAGPSIFAAAKQARCAATANTAHARMRATLMLAYLPSLACSTTTRLCHVIATPICCVCVLLTKQCSTHRFAAKSFLLISKQPVTPQHFFLSREILMMMSMMMIRVLFPALFCCPQPRRPCSAVLVLGLDERLELNMQRPVMLWWGWGWGWALAAAVSLHKLRAVSGEGKHDCRNWVSLGSKWTTYPNMQVMALRAGNPLALYLSWRTCLTL